MNEKPRTVGWMERKIIAILSQSHNVPHVSLSESVLRSVRSTFEKRSFDKAIVNLLSKRQIIESNKSGMTVYKLVA